MAEFGGGIALTRHLDLKVNNVGDIATVSGPDELEKDLALLSIVVLEPHLGRQKTRETESIISARVKEVFLAEPRINSVNSIDISFPDKEKVKVNADVVSDDGPQELVFTIPT